MDHVYETTAPQWVDFNSLTPITGHPTTRDAESFFNESHDDLKTPGYDDIIETQKVGEKRKILLDSADEVCMEDEDDENSQGESTFTNDLEDITLSPVNVKTVERQKNHEGSILQELNRNEVNFLCSDLKYIDLADSVSNKQNQSIDLGIKTPMKRRLRMFESMNTLKLDEAKVTTEKENTKDCPSSKQSNSIDLGVETPIKHKLRSSGSVTSKSNTPKNNNKLVNGDNVEAKSKVSSTVDDGVKQDSHNNSVDLNQSKSPKMILKNVQEINQESEDMFVVHHCQPEVKTANFKQQKKVVSKDSKNLPPKPKAYLSLAEQVTAFQTRTPERFRVSKNPAIQNLKRGPTIPKSPALQSKARSRRGITLSKDEREKKELEEMKKHQIHANPVPKFVLNPPKLQKVPKKPVTTIKPFNLTATKKETTAAASVAASVEPKKLVPKPSTSKKEVVKAISKVTPMKKDSVERRPTALEQHPIRSRSINKSGQSATPKLLLKVGSTDKLELGKCFTPKRVAAQQKSVANFKIKNTEKKVGHFGIPMEDVKAKKDVKKALLLPCKSDLIARSNECLEKRKKKQEEERRKEIEELKKATVFHANPVPNFARPKCLTTSKSKLGGSSKSLKMSTEVGSFNRTNSDGQMIYKNYPSVTANKVPLKPTTSGHTMPAIRNPLKALPVQLQNDQRPKMRKEIDERTKQKLEMYKEKKRLEKENKLMAEQEKLAEERKNKAIKARPMPKFKPPVIARSTKPLTKAQSPTWAKH